MSWSLGLVSAGVVLRWGLGAESFAWLIVFVLLPLCCVYYPVATLPGWLQPVALALPPTYVFEGLRALVAQRHVRGAANGEGAAAQSRLFRARARRVRLLPAPRARAAARWCRWGVERTEVSRAVIATQTCSSCSRFVRDFTLGASPSVRADGAGRVRRRRVRAAAARRARRQGHGARRSSAARSRSPTIPASA